MTFAETLNRHGLQLTRSATTTLQVNIGRTCDLACRHCHQDAGPHRQELMAAETVAAVIAAAERFRFSTIDITGGAPELLPALPELIRGVAPHTETLLVRTNLVALGKSAHPLTDLYRRHRVNLVASLPALSVSQTDAQRGDGVWDRSIAMLTQLNDMGYGQEGSGLMLDLVSNPAGAFLPPSQGQAENRFRQELRRRFGITFNRLLTLTNVPLGRFRTWLEGTGNLADYLDKLAGSFNPATVPGLMCRSFIAVDWDGYLYDCDFNLATGLHHGSRKQHISELMVLPEPGTPIPVADYCYACTAGAGFTCGGSIAA